MLTSEGATHAIQADASLVTIGHIPVTDFAWMRDLGIRMYDDGCIMTDEYGRTNITGVWAVGDITSAPSLAYRAFVQSLVIAESIAGRNPKPVNDDAIANVVFSSPEAASVGLTSEQVRNRDDVASTQETIYPMMGNARMHMSAAAGSMCVVTGEYADRPHVRVILEVHMVAPEASDIIAEAQELIGNRVPLSDAARLIHPHPTFSEAFGEALLKADGRPLHTL